MPSQRKTNKLKVLFAAYEAVPFLKVGGLGDVAGSLPKALNQAGVDCRLIMPLYGSIKPKVFGLVKIARGVRVPTGRGEHRASIWEGKIPGSRVMAYFVDYKPFFGRKQPFGYADDRQRFAFFGKAIIEAMKTLDFVPDVFHGNDWQTGFVPLDLNVEEREDDRFAKVASVYTVHNLAYQGSGAKEILEYAGLSVEDSKYILQDLEDGDIDMMFEGLAHADIISTVSPTYAKEILTKEYGSGMQDILSQRKSRVRGIINGIDYSAFDPSRDAALAKKFTTKNVNKNKVQNKYALQEELGLPKSDAPVLSIVSRLVWQKGIDILADSMKTIAKQDVQLVILGTGEKKIEDQLKKLAKHYPKKVAAVIDFDGALANRIYAASDFFYMPSRYEPCGLGQMIAMRFGTLVIARETGGLADTVLDITKQPKKGTGFTFKPYSAAALTAATRRALAFYKKQGDMEKARVRAMKTDFTWDRSAKEYVRIYKEAIKFNKQSQRKNHA